MELSFSTPYTAMDRESEDQANRDRVGEREKGQREGRKEKITDGQADLGR